jgi:hypothetical protein
VGRKEASLMTNPTRIEAVARSLWLMPVILATWEAESRITIQGQLGKKVLETPPPK